MITADQIRAARALANWSQGELSKRTGLSTPAIGNIEIEKHKPSLETQTKIITAFSDANIEFIDDGVRRRQNIISVFEGPDSIRALFDDIIKTLEPLADAEREMLVFGADDQQFIEYFSLDILKEQLERRKKAAIKQKLLVCEGNMDLIGSKETYRWMPKTFFSSSLTYVYGNNVGMVLWQIPQQVIIIRNKALANERKKNFQMIWNASKSPDGVQK